MGQTTSVNVDSRVRDDILRLFAPSYADEGGLSLVRRRLRSCIENLRAADAVHSGGAAAEDFLQSELPARLSSTVEYFEQLLADVARQSVNLSSPLCMGHMSGVVPQFAGVLAELVATLNQNLVKRDASRALTLVERQALGMMHRVVYGRPEEFYLRHIQEPASTLGLMTTGGTLGNLVALWIARNACFPEADGFPGVEAAGMAAALARYDYDGAVILGSHLMHYSIQKAAGILGLGYQSVIRLPVDGAHRMDVGALRDCLADCARRRLRVMAVMGLAGSTDCGSIDPLAEIGRVARGAGVFFNVDAAWGGPLLFSARHGARLAGIELADSVVIDGHKQMYLPVSTGMLLLREPAIAGLIEKSSHYVIQNGSGDLGRRSIEGSRAGSALFLHAALRLIGAEGYGVLVDESLCKASRMAELVSESTEFQLLLEPETNIVLYRYLPEQLRVTADRRRSFNAGENDRLNEINERLQKRQAGAGRTFTSRTVIECGRWGEGVSVVALRAVIANPLIEERHIRRVLQDQAAVGAELERLSGC